MFVVGDNCLVIHNCNESVDVYSYASKDNHISAKAVDVTAGY